MLAYCVNRKIISLQEVPRTYLLRQKDALQVTLEALRRNTGLPLTSRHNTDALISHYEWLMGEIQQELEIRRRLRRKAPVHVPAALLAARAPDCWL